MVGNRIFGLDLLRAYAVWAVVYAHGYALLSEVVPHRLYSLPTLDGVSIFFALSGFLIGRILLKIFETDHVASVDIFVFWCRRWLRTIPNYGVVLVLLVVGSVFLGQHLPDQLWLYFVFSQNLFSAHPNFFQEAWSLSVEEWFYLALPVLLLFFLRVSFLSKRQTIVMVVLVGVVGVAVYRSVLALHLEIHSVEAWDAHLRKMVFTRFDALLFGVGAAYVALYKHGLVVKWKWWLLVAGLTLLVFDKVFVRIFFSQFYLNHFTLTVTALGAASLTLGLSELVYQERNFFSRLVVGVSKISYSMYLVHHSLVLWMLLPALEKHTNEFLRIDSSAVVYLMYWLLTGVISIVLYKCVERPIMAVRDRHLRA